MQLTDLKNFLPGLDQSGLSCLIDKRGWLSAWACRVWPSGDETRASTYLMVYRSPLVKDTSPVYAGVAAAILAADHTEVLRTALVEDERMMHGCAEVLLLRLSEAGAEPPYAPHEIKWIIDEMEKETL